MTVLYAVIGLALGYVAGWIRKNQYDYRLPDVSRLTLNPDDVLVIKLSSGGIPNRVRDTITDSLPHKNKVLLFDRTLESMSVLGTDMPPLTDLLKLSDKDLQEVLKHCEQGQVVQALVGASPEVVSKVLRCVSKRAALMIREDIASEGVVS